MSTSDKGVYVAYAHDADLGLRARLAGWRCMYMPAAVVYHHHSSTLGRFSERRLVLVERNRAWLALKLFPPGLLLLNPFYVAVRLAASALAALRGRGEAGSFTGARGWWPMLRALSRAWAEALAGLPAVWRKRRQVRRSRKLSDREFLRLLRRFRISARELAFQTIPVREAPETL